MLSPKVVQDVCSRRSSLFMPLTALVGQVTVTSWSSATTNESPLFALLVILFSTVALLAQAVAKVAVSLVLSVSAATALSLVQVAPEVY